MLIAHKNKCLPKKGLQVKHFQDIIEKGQSSKYTIFEPLFYVWKQLTMFY